MAKKKEVEVCYYQRPDGLYEASQRINGKRKVFRGRTCREVERKMPEYREEIAKGRRFPVIADEWERDKEHEAAPGTWRAYHVTVKRLKGEFPGYASEVKPLDIKRYISRFEAQGRAAASVSKELAVCKMIFAYAVLAGDIDVSPATEVKKSRGLPVNPRSALTEEQEEAVRQAGIQQNAHWWLFGYFLLYTGLRRGEALALDYSDIDREKGVIHITKKINYATINGAPVLENHLKSKNGFRDVPLLLPLAKALPKERYGLIFPGEDGGYMTEYELGKHWKQYCRDTGLMQVYVTDNGDELESFNITPHCFRHSFATICYEAGLDPRQAASILGDTPEVLSTVYTHLRESRRLTAAEKLRAHFGEEPAV